MEGSRTKSKNRQENHAIEQRFSNFLAQVAHVKWVIHNMKYTGPSTWSAAGSSQKIDKEMMQ